jgi:O-antigen ligase
MLSAETGIVTTLFFCGWVGWILGQAIQLLIQKLANQKKSGLIVFTYLVAFASLVLFNLFDVTVFDLRMNTIGWLLLAAIAGVVSSNQK